MKTKRRTREKPRRLSKAEIAQIDALLEARHEQTALAGQEVFDQEERERQVLLREDHTSGPWPERPEPRSTVADGDYVYACEGTVRDGHPFLREVARRDGTIRYAWTGGLAFDLSQPWKQDPSWHFVMSRLRGVHPDDADRVIDKVIDDLLVSNIPLSQDIRQFIKEWGQNAHDPKLRERNRDRALAFAIGSLLGSVAEVLRDAGFKDAKTRAAEHLADHWRKVVQQDRRRSRFSSGPALSAWLRHRRGHGAVRHIRKNERIKRSICPVCKTGFEAVRIDATFCSSACRQRAYRLRRP